MSNRSLEILNDVEDIKQLKALHCRLINQKRWEELEADFVPDAVIEIAGAPAGGDDTLKFDLARAVIDGLRQFMAPLVSVHQVHAPEIEILTEATAQGRWAISDRLVLSVVRPGV